MQRITTYSSAIQVMQTSFGLMLLVALFIASCDSGTGKKEKPLLTVSILPQKYFAQKICGDQDILKTIVRVSHDG